MSQSHDKSAVFEQALARAGVQKVDLRLFVAGMSPRSTQAIGDLKRLCDEFLGENCNIEVVDIYEHPAAARQAQIIAVPTLVCERPLPQRKLIGSIGNFAKVLRSLGLVPRRVES